MTPQGDERAKPHDSFDRPQDQLGQLRTKSGLALRLIDDGEEEVAFELGHPKDNKLGIDKDGIVTIRDAQGAELRIDPQAKAVQFKGHTNSMIEFGDNQITLSAG